MQEASLVTRLIGALVLLLPALVLIAQEQPANPPTGFHGTYAELKPAQKKLIDEWYAEYNRLTHEQSSPTEYDQLSLSTRTTYEAVTHALLTTQLTDKSGKSMGNALELVRGIEAIAGKIPRARGDLQFRMYALLKPDALQKLKDSSEFFRDRDNTVFHQGYPLNYRQEGLPSIQFSMAKDGRHADIDVDYRSSRIPAALFNGHLTAANSDVRAGNNTQKHLQRWQGLTDWWRNLFGLPESMDNTDTIVEGEVPAVPRKGEGKLEDANRDFLEAWLVEQKPELSAAYLSPRLFACLKEYGPQAGNEINAGVAPYVAAKDMAATNHVLGKVAILQDAVKPAPLDDPSFKVMKQSNATAFSLYQVTNGVAAELECDPENAYADFDKSRISKTSGNYGSYFVSAFRLKATKGKSDAITLLWTKEGKYWKVVAWEIEPEEAKPGTMPDTRGRRALAAAAAPKAYSKADPDFLSASHDFLHSWLVADDFNQAATYFSQRANACANAYLAEGEKAPATPAEYSTYIRSVITSVGKDVGTVQHLRDAMEPVQPSHDDLQAVPHAGEDAYTVVAVPDYLADSFGCEKESVSHPFKPAGGTALQKTYGNYYATLFALRTPGDHPAALTLLWNKEGGQWKIIAYEVLAP
jgi:hypothetical protein